LKNVSIIIGFLMLTAGCVAHIACLSYIWNCVAPIIGVPHIGLKEALLIEVLTWVLFPIQHSDYLEDPESFTRAIVRRMFVTLTGAGIAWITCHV